MKVAIKLLNCNGDISTNLKGGIMRKITRINLVSSAIISASCLGVSGLASAASISDTGPFSTNTISSGYSNSSYDSNHNMTWLWNKNHQKAWTGCATSSYNTTGGGTWSGNAGNDNNNAASVGISNSGNSGGLGGSSWSGSGGGGSDASINETGPFSSNHISSIATTQPR